MEEASIRIDKWLKVARFYKQRELAAEAVESGKVRVNGERVKPAKLIKTGDELTVKHDNSYLKFIVKKITDKSVSKEDARGLYEAVNKPEPPKEMNELMKIIEEQDRQNQEEMKHKGRPTKKDRRILNKYKYMTND
ncbi:MAG TPA: RNA-binding S4 domain-containing protein [Clostridiales bacterium]|jgi:ribosome-associated heat shock protein Hsp15|nr:RNA-binding S4 domain-containing protein [Clostridiales bacterium]HQP69523.1 RNA-binding S4 domain-containing protein [Clostridiales bacterium]